MRKKKFKKKFHARVEIYFVIYLATIISFFSVEGEVKEYKDKVEKTILAIAKDKVEQLVNIGQIAPYHEKETLTLNLQLNGFFDKNSLKGKLLFKKTNENGLVEGAKVFEYKLSPLNQEEGDKWFTVTIPKKDFEKELNVAYQVTADLSVKPQFNEELHEKWMHAYKDEAIVKKLISAIKQVGRIPLSKTFPNKIVPIGVGAASPFTMQTPKDSYSVLQGLNWEVPIYIGGVKENSDFRISVIQGSELVTDKIVRTPETIIKGVGLKSGHIKIVGTRNNDDEKTSVEFGLNVRPPVWTIAPTVKQIYFGEAYTFDGSLRGIPIEDISVEVSGNAVENKRVNSAQVLFDNFDKEGTVEFQVYVAGNKINSMSHQIQVLKPPPPEIEFLSRDAGSNNVYFKITTFGKSNKVLRFQQRGGIVRNQQEGEPVVIGSKKQYKWLVEIEKPFEETAFQEISFKIWDELKQVSEHRKQYQYNY